ncbi:MAG: hypothetical protein CEE38_04975 [Planctomycetes bacterium B3_Pla]|nr:MAG: hypothetical protein CEE38_04975 [Planctomycetes bacterium B3_Pla]
MKLRDVKTTWFLLKYSVVKRSAIPYFKEVLRNQYLSGDEIEALNWRRTRELLEYANQHVSFYRERFKAMGLNPSEIVRPEHYSQVPVLTRDDLRVHFDKMVSDEARPADLRISTTGGSTGKPVKVYHQKKVVRAAMPWRMLNWWGLAPDVNVASVYRIINEDWKSNLLNNLFWWPTKRILLDAASVDDKSIAEFLRKFRLIRPELVHGYVGAVDYLATYILDRKIALPSPKAIWVTSSPVTATQEVRIHEAFGAPVYDQYGGCEVYWLAAQCPKKEGLHMFHDVRRIEFLSKDNAPVTAGELGRIAITDLENKYFPLIRYLNGDEGRALPKNCSCGVNLPLMDKVRGRISDTIKLPNGAVVGGDYLTTIFDSVPDAVCQFQVHQHKDYSIDIVVVPNTTYANYEKVLENIRANLSTQFRNAVPVSIKQVAEIPHQSGKLRFVKSDL